MRKIVKMMFAFVIVSFVAGTMPNVVGMLGVSNYAATRVVDAILAGASAWTILSLIAAGGGALAIGLGLFKEIVKRVGRNVAIGW